MRAYVYPRRQRPRWGGAVPHLFGARARGHSTAPHRGFRPHALPTAPLHGAAVPVPVPRPRACGLHTASSTPRRVARPKQENSPPPPSSAARSLPSLRRCVSVHTSDDKQTLCVGPRLAAAAIRGVIEGRGVRHCADVIGDDAYARLFRARSNDDGAVVVGGLSVPMSPERYPHLAHRCTSGHTTTRHTGMCS